MKVLIINTLCGSGSTGKIVSDLYKMLKFHGHQVKVAYAHGTPTNVGLSDTFRITGKIGYYVHNMLTQLTDRAGFFSTIETLRFIKYMETYSPDVIHLHNIHGYYINIKLLFEYLQRKNLPVIWTLHDCWAFTGHCYHYSFQGCNKWLDQCYSCPLKHRYPKSLFLDQSRRNYKDKKKLFTSLSQLQIVTPSVWLKSQVEKSFLGRFNCQAIYNGIDLGIFYPQGINRKEEYGIPEEKKLLLAVSFVWSKTKGLDDLILLNTKIDHSLYQLMIVGLDPQQIETLPSDIIKVARTSSVKELAEIYTMADVFINPSYEETMGMVTAEALACGTPAIVYNKTAVPEVVDEKSGIVVEAGDVDAIVQNVPKAIGLKKEHVIERAKNFERNQQYEKYYKLYFAYGKCGQN